MRSIGPLRYTKSKDSRSRRLFENALSPFNKALSACPGTMPTHVSFCEFDYETNTSSPYGGLSPLSSTQQFLFKRLGFSRGMTRRVLYVEQVCHFFRRFRSVSIAAVREMYMCETIVIIIYN